LRFSESLFASVLLLTLPLAWLARVTSRRWVWVTAVIGLWLLAGSSLQGTAPRVVGVYYAFAGLQAAFLALVFLRYDLLTVWSTIFTVQTAVAGLPTFELFRSVDPLPYAMGLVAWFLVVLFGVYLAFRPQVVAGWRRVVTAFE
jgi:FtsH-binding integral membrane protein